MLVHIGEYPRSHADEPRRYLPGTVYGPGHDWGKSQGRRNVGQKDDKASGIDVLYRVSGDYTSRCSFFAGGDDYPTVGAFSSLDHY